MDGQPMAGAALLTDDIHPLSWHQARALISIESNVRKSFGASKMNILFVTGIFPPDHGGPARYVPLIAQSLMARGHRVVAMITLSDVDHDDEHYAFQVVRLRRSMPRLLRILQTIATIRKFARGADVVYLNGLVFEGFLAIRLLGCKRTVIKVVGDLVWERARNAKATTLNLDAFQTEPLTWYWQALRRLQCFYMCRADAVITPSAYLAGIVRQWGVAPERIHVVYNAVEPMPVAADVIAEYDMVSVARLVTWKGLDSLIRVTATHNLSLLIVGDGPLRQELQQIVDDCGAQVMFAGNVPASRVAAEIRRGRLFVLNSTYEGLPHIILEAMHAETAVLATDAGGTPETIAHDEDGWLIPAGDQQALESAILMLLTHENLRSRLVGRAKYNVARRFSHAMMVQQTEAVLAGSKDAGRA
jgi:glycosyltransferase involved in cell wall biosynthesis